MIVLPLCAPRWSSARLVAGLSAHERGAGDVRLDQLKDAGKRIARGGAHAFRSMEIKGEATHKWQATEREPSGFKHHKDLFSETACKTSRNSEQRWRSEPLGNRAVVAPSSRRIVAG